MVDLGDHIKELKESFPTPADLLKSQVSRISLFTTFDPSSDEDIDMIWCSVVVAGSNDMHF